MNYCLHVCYHNILAVSSDFNQVMADQGNLFRKPGRHSSQNVMITTTELGDSSGHVNRINKKWEVMESYNCQFTSGESSSGRGFHDQEFH